MKRTIDVMLGDGLPVGKLQLFDLVPQLEL